MTVSSARVGDQLSAVAGYGRPLDDAASVRGFLHVVLTGPDGEVKHEQHIRNLVTQVGDQYYGERAAGIGGAPAAITGMQLGTGTTAPAKTGAGAAAIGTLVAASLVALSGAPTSALNTGKRRITYSVAWAAGVATANGIAEVALVNQSTGTQTVAPESATIARALLSPIVNKGSGDTLTVNWSHDLLGA